jgi:hypothetical protein
MSISANRLWRQQPEEIRIAACKIYWSEAKGADRQVLFASLAKAKNLREVFVRKTPIERLAHWTAATMSLPDVMVDDFLKKYLLHEHSGVIITFLDSLKIPHKDAIIEESFDLETLSSGQVQDAARTLLGSSDRVGAMLYLKYLVVQGGPWAAIEEVLPAEE